MLTARLGKFVWTDGAGVLGDDAGSYTNWSAGEPNDWGTAQQHSDNDMAGEDGEDCGEVHASGTWNVRAPTPHLRHPRLPTAPTGWLQRAPPPHPLPHKAVPSEGCLSLYIYTLRSLTKRARKVSGWPRRCKLAHAFL